MVKLWGCICSLLLVLVFSTGAKANVIYNFNGTLTGGITDTLNLQLVVTDAAVAHGSLSFSVSAYTVPCGPAFSFPCNFTGDPSGFVSLNGPDPFFSAANPNFQGDFFFGLGFNSDGTLSGNILFSGFNDTLRISGTNGIWSGTLNSDGAPCPFETCAVVGTFRTDAQIPEPPTWLVMFAGLVSAIAATYAARRRQ